MIFPSNSKDFLVLMPKSNASLLICETFAFLSLSLSSSPFAPFFPLRLLFDALKVHHGSNFLKIFDLTSLRFIFLQTCLVSQDIGYQIFATASSFYVPLFVILILYWRIFQTARKRIRRRGNQSAVGGVQLKNPSAGGVVAGEKITF